MALLKLLDWGGGQAGGGGGEEKTFQHLPLLFGVMFIFLMSLWVIRSKVHFSSERVGQVYNEGSAS